MEAILALEDGRVFRGASLGSSGSVVGEVVFNTGMTGYQEIMTDPSYRGQIVTLTVPHVGNTGINDEDPESAGPRFSGLVIRESTRLASSWRARGELDNYMRVSGIVGIEGLDTRALTRHLRSGGVVRGCISTLRESPEQAVDRAASAPRIEEQDLVAEATCKRSYVWNEGRTGLLGPPSRRNSGGCHVSAFDYGAKRNMLRLLADQGVRVTVVPASTTASDVLALRPDGIFLSNGPGDPSTMDPYISTIGALIGKLPVFGICLGHQLLARAVGASTFKLKFGHRGINHPVQDLASGRVAITSQNHGYAVDESSLAEEIAVTHRSLYDGTVEGLAHRDLPLFSVQFHPEAAPGPHDTWDLFGRFVDMIQNRRPDGSTARLRSA